MASLTVESSFLFLFGFIIFSSSSMWESSILFNLSTSSKTGWKYSRRLLNKGGVSDGCGCGVVLAIDSLVCCSPPIAAVFYYQSCV